MKNLSQFKDFKHQEFLEKKRLYFLGVKTVKNENGVKVSLLILEDKTVDDFIGFKPLQTECKIVNVKKATIYGDYQNQLSIHADVIEANQTEDKKWEESVQVGVTHSGRAYHVWYARI